MKHSLFIITFGLLTFSTAAQQKIYLSPNAETVQNGSKSKPYSSLNQAFKGQLSNTLTDTLYVEVASGTYRMTEPLIITEQNSRPIIVRSQTADKPIFNGAIAISGWEKCGQNIYRAYVPEVRGTNFNFEQFFVNGQRAQMARTPNTDWYYVKGSAETPIVKAERIALYATQKLSLEPSDLETLKGLSSNELDQVRIRYYHKWDNTRRKIDYLVADSGYVYMGGYGMKPWNPITAGTRYTLYNYPAALDVEREWYLDDATGYIYYMPAPDEDMATAQCYAPALRQFIQMDGHKDAIKNIAFQNLSFQYTSYLLPQHGDNPEQAAASVEAAMMFDNVENISFTDCEILHTGAYAIWFGGSCLGNRVEHCYIADLGAGGVKLGRNDKFSSSEKLTANNIIHNNIITDAGSEFPCAVGVGIFHAANNTVTNNEIFDLLYSGVSVGWVWGYSESPAIGNIIEYNKIHHIGWGELSDMGAVYTLGISPGTTVSNNVIHDVLSYDYGGWGLYTDEGSTGVTMENNLVYRCKSGGFHQHYGRENKIENNIFAYGYYNQAQYTRVEPHTSFSFKRNIILQDKGMTLAGSGVWSKGKMDIDSNLYWHLDGELKFEKAAQMDFKTWKAKKEPKAVNADPLFVDAAADNYTFSSLKNIKKIGFRPFDYSKAGVYGSEQWLEKAKLSPQKAQAFEQAAKTRLKQ